MCDSSQLGKAAHRGRLGDSPAFPWRRDELFLGGRHQLASNLPGSGWPKWDAQGPHAKAPGRPTGRKVLGERKEAPPIPGSRALPFPWVGGLALAGAGAVWRGGAVRRGGFPRAEHVGANARGPDAA